MGLPNLTFQQLFEYLERGEKDPYVEAALNMPGNRERLARVRRLYELVKGGGPQDEGPSSAESVDSVSELAFDGLDKPLKEDFFEAERAHSLGTSKTMDWGQSKERLLQAAQTMRLGGDRVRVSGTLRIGFHRAIPDLEYVPRSGRPPPPKSSSKSVSFEDTASFESIPGASLDMDVDSVSFRRVPRRETGERKTPYKRPSSASSVQLRLGPLAVTCSVDPAHVQPVLAFVIRDTRWRAPAKQLEILYVPNRGRICRVTTDLKGRASMALPAESGRLRFASDPAVVVEIEIQE